MNMHTATNTNTEATRSPHPLRAWTKAYHTNPHNRTRAHELMAYIKRNPMALCEATGFDIEALCRATELVGE